jgi:capsular polysaccharide biosynthesis protein
MKKKERNIIYLDDEIDFAEMIKKFKRDKILILFITLIFMVVGYIYQVLQTKIYKTEIIFREPPIYLFESFIPFSEKLEQKRKDSEILAKVFNYNFKANLLSLDTAVEFAENNNKISYFKKNHQKKNISINNYFKEKLKIEINKEKIILNYSDFFPGEIFLNDYVNFVKEKTLTSFKIELTQRTLSEISLYQDNLKIAEKIKLDTPLQSNSQVVVNNSSAYTELFYQGSTVLTQKLLVSSNFLNKIKNLTLDYDPIVQKATLSTLTSKKPETIMIFAFVLGLFMSLFILYLR